jgi:hypothetical protein
MAAGKSGGYGIKELEERAASADLVQPAKAVEQYKCRSERCEAKRAEKTLQLDKGPYQRDMYNTRVAGERRNENIKRARKCTLFWQFFLTFQPSRLLFGNLRARCAAIARTVLPARAARACCRTRRLLSLPSRVGSAARLSRSGCASASSSASGAPASPPLPSAGTGSSSSSSSPAVGALTPPPLPLPAAEASACDVAAPLPPPPPPVQPPVAGAGGHYYVWSSTMSRARVYADVNTVRPREYWDYESLVSWGGAAQSAAAAAGVAPCSRVARRHASRLSPCRRSTGASRRTTRSSARSAAASTAR